jgi:NTP pyrophosphatase (non-canonical NTP hydrolase)
MENEARQFMANYSRFVDTVTSDESKDIETFIDRVRELHAAGINVPRYLTGGVGLASESGEFDEVLKKMLFQGKPVNDENIFHLKRELGDIIWYWAQACMALNIDPVDVILENIEKLKARYPGGEFDAFYSENRKDGDL